MPPPFSRVERERARGEAKELRGGGLAGYCADGRTDGRCISEVSLTAPSFTSRARTDRPGVRSVRSVQASERTGRPTDRPTATAGAGTRVRQSIVDHDRESRNWGWDSTDWDDPTRPDSADLGWFVRGDAPGWLAAGRQAEEKGSIGWRFCSRPLWLHPLTSVESTYQEEGRGSGGKPLAACPPSDFRSQDRTAP